MFNRASEIALLAMSCLAEAYTADGVPRTAAEIANDRRISRHYVSKVMRVLAHHGLVTSAPGRRGGYRLAQPPSTIMALDVVRCFGRQTRVMRCPLGHRHCPRQTQCPLHDQIKDIQDRARAVLEETSLSAMVAG